MSEETTKHFATSAADEVRIEMKPVGMGKLAHYRDEVGLFADNELVRALPPLPSYDEAIDFLSHKRPPRGKDFRSLPLVERTQHLALMNQMFIPMGRHAKAMVSILQAIRAGYHWRGFKNPSVWKHITTLGHFRHSQAMLSRSAPGGGGAVGMLLSGITGAGKTSFLDRLLAYLPNEPIIHTQVNGLPHKQPQIPYIRIQCPHKASVSALAKDVIEQISAITGKNYLPAAGKMTEPVLLGLMRSVCSNLFLGVLIVDDVQFLRGLNTNAEPVLNTFCSFMELTGIPILLCGTLKMRSLMSTYTAGNKLAASGNNIRFDALSTNSSDWENLVSALWACSVLREPVPLPSDFVTLLHRYTLGVPRITREVMQAVHLRMAHLEEEGDLARLLNAPDPYKGLLDQIAEDEILHYQAALNVLYKSANGQLSQAQALRYEDLVIPPEDLKSLAENKRMQDQEDAEKKQSAAKREESESSLDPGKKKRPATPKRQSQAPDADHDELVKHIIGSADPQAEINKALGLPGSSLTDIA